MCAYHVTVYLHGESDDGGRVERWILSLLPVNQSVLGDETVGPSWFTPSQAGRVRPCHRANNVRLITWHGDVIQLWWTHLWVWQWEEPYFLVSPARSEPKPTGSRPSLWHCERELCTGSNWRAAGRGSHQKTPAAPRTRWTPGALPLFRRVACGINNRMKAWLAFFIALYCLKHKWINKHVRPSISFVCFLLIKNNLLKDEIQTTQVFFKAGILTLSFNFTAAGWTVQHELICAKWTMTTKTGSRSTATINQFSQNKSEFDQNTVTTQISLSFSHQQLNITQCAAGLSVVY